MTRRFLRVLFLGCALHGCATHPPMLEGSAVALHDQTPEQQRADWLFCETAARDYMNAAAAGVAAQRNAAIGNALFGAVAGAATGAAVGAAFGNAGFGAKVGTASWGTQAAFAPVPPVAAPSMLGYWNKFRLMRDLAEQCLIARGYYVNELSVDRSVFRFED